MAVADYLVLSDSAVSLNVNDKTKWNRDFNLGEAARLDLSMILQFFYVSLPNADLSFRFSINNHTIRTINVTGNRFGTIHEVLNGDKLRHGSNDLKVQLVLPSSGTVQFSDVVLWFRRTA